MRKFLHIQQNPGDDTDPADLDVLTCPPVHAATHIDVFHSARAVFCAPSNPCGVGGMYREVIRSTPSWRKGEITAARRDCVFLAKGDAGIQDGFRGLLVARVYLLFSFKLQGTTYPCALVCWFETFGDGPDPDTGMWITQPEFDNHGYRNAAVVHIDSIVRGAHLLPIFGNSFIDEDLNYTQSLDAFIAFYVNKYADHHSHEIAF